MDSQVKSKGFFSTIYDGWLLFAELVGRFNTKVIVSIIYFGAVSIAWFATSTCIKRQLLDKVYRISGNTAWIERDHDSVKITIEKLRHQF